MLKSRFGMKNRMGLSLLTAVVCTLPFQAPQPALGQVVPMIDQGEVTSVTDSSATINWIAPPAEAGKLEAAVFYGKEDAGTQEGGWGQHADLVQRGKERGKFQVVLEDLEPDTSYIYRIRTIGKVGEAKTGETKTGETWSATATFHTEAWNLPWYVYLLIVVAILAVPFAVGGRLAKRFRMPDHGWKIGLILWTLACGLVIIGFRWPPKLGIDLSGGTILIYEVEKDPDKLVGQQQGDADKPVDMDKLVAAVSERVNPGGTKEMTIRPYGGEQIEIIIPRIDPEEAKRVEKIVGQTGMLEFRILANRVDHPNLLKRARSGQEGNVLRDANGEIEAWWVPVQVGQEESFEHYMYSRDAQGHRTRIPPEGREVAIRESVRRGERTLELLVAKDSFDVDGGYLTDARSDWDETGNPRVSFQFNSEGGLLFGRLTAMNLPDEVQDFYRKLAVILDNRLYSAPRIKSRISDRGVIEGSFTQEEVDDLVRVLNAGSLPTALNQEPIFRLVTGPTLGHDQVIKGSWSIGASVVLVLLFMVFYYRFSGIVACGALLTNLVMILAIMITVGAAFTLPGLAGLVLTVGMAVDANVLIFERIREELGRGAALRMAIRNGFDRATTTIVDANVTTLITGIILFVIGTDVIKGFAITLILGVLLSMYTAIFCSRVVFDIAERRHWITELTMMRILGATQIDFVGRRRLAAALSLLVIVAGLTGVTLRSVGQGVGLLDIDFMGGVSVVTIFDKPQDIGDVREAFRDLPDLAVSDVQLEQGLEGTWFRVNTSQGPEMDEANHGKVKRSAIQVVEQRIRQAVDQMRKSAIEAAQQRLTGLLEAKPAAVEVVQTQLKKVLEDPSDNEKQEAAIGAIKGQLAGVGQGQDDVAAIEEELRNAFGTRLAANIVTVGTLELIAEKETKKAAKETPAGSESPDQTRTELPHGSMPPMAGLAPVLLAGADPSGAEEPAHEPAAEHPPSGGDPAHAPDAKPETPSKVTEDEHPASSPGKSKEPGEEPPGPAQPAGDAFAGGTEVRLTFAREVSYETVRGIFVTEFGSEEQLPPLELTPLVASANSAEPTPDLDFAVGDRTPYKIWNVKIKLPQKEAESRLNSIKAAVAETPFFPSSNTIGGKVATSTRMQAIYALAASLLFIVAYIWIRFQRVIFGLAAVVALVHDVLVTLGVIALSAFLAPYLGFLLIDPFKIGLPVLAAFLTIIGYSLNDTIVVFDRIREVRGKSPRLSQEMVNISINQTLARTLLTSLTTLIVVVILYIFGGQRIHAFAFALVIGVVVGTYSSVFVASPVLLWMTRSSNAK